VVSTTTEETAMTAATMIRPDARTRLVDDAGRLADAVSVLGDRDRHARALARWTRAYLRVLRRHIRADGLEQASLDELIDGLETCLIGLEDDRLPWIPVRARARTFSRRLAEYLELYGHEVLSADPDLDTTSPVARLVRRVGQGSYDRLERAAFSVAR
jgi:hypothetical protein